VACMYRGIGDVMCLLSTELSSWDSYDVITVYKSVPTMGCHHLDILLGSCTGYETYSI